MDQFFRRASCSSGSLGRIGFGAWRTIPEQRVPPSPPELRGGMDSSLSLNSKWISGLKKQQKKWRAETVQSSSPSRSGAPDLLCLLEKSQAVIDPLKLPFQSLFLPLESVNLFVSGHQRGKESFRPVVPRKCRSKSEMMQMVPVAYVVKMVQVR